MRDHIINEIKRLASESGGSPPGQRMFEQQTGITRGQWRGKFWVAWGDAIEEAGLSPNSVTIRLDKDRILDCLSEVCRHYKRPPTWAEWQIFARSRTDFVGVGSLHRAFVNTESAIAALRDRAVRKGEDDLVSILPRSRILSSEEEVGSSSGFTDGWVYLLQSGTHFKIGRSDDLEKRVKQITIALPAKVIMVHAIQTDDPPGIEAYWHRRFAEKRANGEWFELSTADVKAFKRRKSQ